MSARDVVATGLGATTPLGGDVESLWKGLLAGRSCVRRIDDLLASCSYPQELPTKIAAPMAVSPDEALPRVQARRLDRCQQAALVAAGQAWVQAGSEVDSRRLVGHLMGAAGAVEAIITVLSIANSVVSPTLNLQRRSPESSSTSSSTHPANNT